MQTPTIFTEEFKAKQIEKAKRTKREYESGYLSMDKGYKFRTKDFLSVVFLYTNSVDVKNPDILGNTNKNTFILDAMDAIEKIKEQVRIDIRDMNFLVKGASSLSRFIVKAANRKVLEENDFSVDIDQVVDDAVDFGSGYLKVWNGIDGQLRIKSVDPYKIIFNQEDFAGGQKIEVIDTTFREVIQNEKYDEGVRQLLSKRAMSNEDLDKRIELNQVLTPVGQDKQLMEIILFADGEEFYLFGHEDINEESVQYFKFDYKKRRGFKDALGIGAIEKIFNIIVQDKVNRERLDRVMSRATKMVYQQEVMANGEDLSGKQLEEIKDDYVIGHKGNRLEPLNLGGSTQLNFIISSMNDLTGKASRKLNVGDALQGNTLPSGTSGELGNLLTENQSSVHKEVQKNYAKFLSRVYRLRINPFILNVFDKADDIEKYLEKNDVQMIKLNVMNYLIALKQIDSVILDEPFDYAQAKAEVKREMKGKPIISGDLLDTLREEANGIEPYISAESVSKAAVVSFLREIRTQYVANPELFKNPTFVNLLKEEAQYNAGISSLEIDNLLQDVQENSPVPNG